MDDDSFHGFGSGGKELQHGGRHVEFLLVSSVGSWRRRRRLRLPTYHWYSMREPYGEGGRVFQVWPVPELMRLIFDLALLDGFHGKYMFVIAGQVHNN